jgi:glycine/D-amino acid oxidase-like deaminating enzyme
MESLTIFEQLETPVLAAYDVIVCGGGIAGAAAAVAAKRAGASVLLLEKSVMFGGLATNGLISFYDLFSRIMTMSMAG